MWQTIHPFDVLECRVHLATAHFDVLVHLSGANPIPEAVLNVVAPFQDDKINSHLKQDDKRRDESLAEESGVFHSFLFDKGQRTRNHAQTNGVGAYSVVVKHDIDE